jgi:hypothetical protein
LSAAAIVSEGKRVGQRDVGTMTVSGGSAAGER